MMLYKNKYRVESARLQNWDYSSNGCYYITICTHDRSHYFGTIQNGEVAFSDMGKIVEQYWCEIPNHFPFVQLDEWVIMPNHVHGIIAIENFGTGAATGSGDSDNCYHRCNHHHHRDKAMPGRDKAMPGRDKAMPCLYKCNKCNNNGNIHPTNNKIPISRFQNQGRGTISAIIGSYKSVCTKTINKSQNKIPFAWQPRFHDHIIRDEIALNRIRKYIANNPTNWDSDDLNCK